MRSICTASTRSIRKRTQETYSLGFVLCCLLIFHVLSSLLFNYLIKIWFLVDLFLSWSASPLGFSLCWFSVIQVNLLENFHHLSTYTQVLGKSELIRVLPTQSLRVLPQRPPLSFPPRTLPSLASLPGIFNMNSKQ